jgi:rubrerythrin
MSISNLMLTYVVVLLAGISGLGVYTELRRRRFQPTPTEDRIFRCRKCGYLYTDDPDVDRSRCSQCGRMNEAIEF